MANYYAHSKENIGTDQWHLLEDHLKEVAGIASGFASTFEAKDWAKIAGEFHDLGKATRLWQAYLRKVNGIDDEFAGDYAGHPTHADVGARFLYQRSSDVGMLLAYVIAGHHGGMPDYHGKSAGTGLKSRLENSGDSISMPIPKPEFPEKPPFDLSDADRSGYQLQFFTRMIFSCLVDADWLDTERFMDVDRANGRGGFPLLKELHDRFWDSFNRLRSQTDPKSPVNRQREVVLQDCIDAAQKEPGIFSLTVPTGGGKTLASLAFALNHAKKYHKTRIIYIIPFTSIIELNARVFREHLGEDAVLEHHCNFVQDDAQWKTRLASENWEAPIVVTTNVQFFDSFYANKPSRCRKLHNIAQSIVIFDEVQAIPVEKLKPCLEVIKELSLNYGVTSVLCTATQPAVEYSEDFPSGLKNVREIVRDVPDLFSQLKRTREEFIGELDEETVASRIAEHEQVLCIVNTRKHALDIFNALPDSDDDFHLSALMYPKHRTKKLNEIRQRLGEGKPCRVVSTQLIEAGVDVDFPCVYRQVAGIDSIAQAAGRCNRNGKSDTAQPVYVFRLSEKHSTSFFRQAAQSAEKLFESYAGELTSPDCVRAYFEDYFWKNEQRMDGDDIGRKCSQAVMGKIPFKEIAEFQMIKNATNPVIIALDPEASRLVDSLNYSEKNGGILRKLQQYTVQIYPYQMQEIQEWLENPQEGIRVLRDPQLYSDQTGLECRAPQGEAFFA